MEKDMLLSSISLGNSVAEFDKNLGDYFINTPYAMWVINDRYDIIRGTKGSGKTAILLNILDKQENIKELQDILLVPAVNHHGDPVFRAVFSNLALPIDESKLIEAWKVYLINVIWNEIKENIDDIKELGEYLEQKGLITETKSLLERIRFSFGRIFKIQEFQGTVVDPVGTSYTGKVTLGENKLDQDKKDDRIDYNYIFEMINDMLMKQGLSLWVLLDRLDDAFTEDKDLENVALKCLLKAYKDIAGLQNLKLKVFIRDDIYKRITNEGFSALTHVNANAMEPIKWSEERLLNLFIERLLFNKTFKEYLTKKGINVEEPVISEEILRVLFREQIDIGENNPNTFRWILNHIRDSNGIVTARDLIALVDKAIQFQLEIWSVEGINNEEDYLIGPTAIKRAWSAVSKDKLETQIYAEYPNLKSSIEKFRYGKAEHNSKTLRKILGNDWKSIIEELKQHGFIEELTNSKSWKIPFLYREGLNISQGKAY